MPQARIPTIVRYFAKVDQSAGPAGCWPWTGAKDPDGYGIFWDGTYRRSGAGHYVRVTRWTYQQFVGPIPQGHQLLHRCDNPPCVNLAHLFTGTDADNHADREAKGRGRRLHGSDHTGSKLTEEQVRLIRARWDAKQAAGVDLAQEFGVTSAAISRIVNRKTWTHM